MIMCIYTYTYVYYVCMFVRTYVCMHVYMYVSNLDHISPYQLYHQVSLWWSSRISLTPHHPRYWGKHWTLSVAQLHSHLADIARRTEISNDCWFYGVGGGINHFCYLLGQTKQSFGKSLFQSVNHLFLWSSFHSYLELPEGNKEGPCCDYFGMTTMLWHG